MESNAGVALVCGRRVERFPEASIYNRLCDLEWDGPAGETPACGGDALIRAKALARSGGYNPDVIAGEEPELCVRLRQAGWKILRIAETMTIHDAAMTRFSQWWKRSFRAGHAYAEGAARHGRSAQRHFVREYRSNWSWGLALPLAVAVAAPLSHGWSLAALALYPLLFLRIAYRRHRMLQTPWRHAVLYAAACVVGKFPQVLGQLRYWVSRWRGKRTRLIEYKSSAKPTHEHGQHVAAG
jgi:cellulose synthase/poly-beta-1,6-N-acetylglucosamine synthase-like glycosyltransferase